MDATAHGFGKHETAPEEKNAGGDFFFFFYCGGDSCSVYSKECEKKKLCALEATRVSSLSVVFSASVLHAPLLLYGARWCVAAESMENSNSTSQKRRFCKLIW